jgi:hypothetical protein
MRKRDRGLSGFQVERMMARCSLDCLSTVHPALDDENDCAP